jgi:hypothetical protein
MEVENDYDNHTNLFSNNVYGYNRQRNLSFDFLNPEKSDPKIDEMIFLP